VAAGACAAGSSAGCSGAGVAAPPQAGITRVRATNKPISQNKRLLISFLLELISTQKFAKRVFLEGKS
jgi:hypothetical protein